MLYFMDSLVHSHVFFFCFFNFPLSGVHSGIGYGSHGLEILEI